MSEHNNNIIKELKEISPFLADQSKNMPFNIPDGYFEQLGADMFIKSYGVDSPQSVPPGYFESLPKLIMSKLADESPVVQMRSRSSFFRYAAAALITGILGLSLFSTLNQSTEPDSETTAILLAEAKQILKTGSLETTFQSLSEEEIESYLKGAGHDIKAALVATAACSDESELPEPLEYLSGDEALADFMSRYQLEKN